MAYPAPTAAPLLARSVAEVEHKMRRRQQDDVLSPSNNREDAVILGPFHARTEKDILALRKETGTEGKDLLNGQAYLNAKAWLRQQGDKKGMMYKRQTSADQACFVGNNRLSCYPQSGMRFEQDTWGKVITLRIAFYFAC